MFVVHGTFPIRPEAVDDLRAILPPLVDATRREAGCVSYDWVQSIEEPTSFTSIEVWRSRDDLDAHFATEHVRASLARLPDLLGGQPTLVAFEAGDPIDLPL